MLIFGCSNVVKFPHIYIFSRFSFFKRFYQFIFRERGREGERERETSVCGCSHVSPTGDLACNPRLGQVPGLGIELAAHWFAGPCSIYWAMPARAILLLKVKCWYLTILLLLYIYSLVLLILLYIFYIFRYFDVIYIVVYICVFIWCTTVGSI